MCYNGLRAVPPRQTARSPVSAGMVELVDTQDLGSCAARREGSSPFFRSLAVIFGENPEYLLFVLEKSEYIVYDNTVYI